jgi:hypothetical protein
MAYRRDATLKNPRRFKVGRVLAQGTWEGWQAGKELRLEESGDSLKWSFNLGPKSFTLFEFGHPTSASMDR